MKKIRFFNDGFTLIEIISVMIIIGVVSAVSLSSMFSNIRRTSEAHEAFPNLSQNKDQIEICYQQNGRSSLAPCLAIKVPSSAKFTYQASLLASGTVIKVTASNVTNDGEISMTRSAGQSGEWQCSSSGIFAGICAGNLDACQTDADCQGGKKCISGICSCENNCTFCNNACIETDTFQSDIQNCGTCGNVCLVGMSCVDGSCVCPSGLTFCNGSCLDLQSDPNHCGSCESSVCVAPNSSCCGGVCVDTTTNQSDCGTCGAECLVGQQICCNSNCTFLSSDENNCGACGNRCLNTQCCSNGGCINVDKNTDTHNCGACRLECSTNCCVEGACLDADLMSDPTNCGSCAARCSVTEACCGGSCVNLQADVSNCGSCGGDCMNRGYQSPGCCGGNCVELATDWQNCGFCSNNCATGFECVGGACVIPE